MKNKGIKRRILITINPYESRAAILENGIVKELFFEARDSEKIVGCIFKGRVAKIIPGTQSAFVDIGLSRDAFLALDNVISFSEGDFEEGFNEFSCPIEDCLKVGQELAVQILKEPVGNKGPRSTTVLSFPGRYLVLTPTFRHIGVSKKISSETERNRLKKIGKSLCGKEYGLIFRTAAEGVEPSVLEEDFQMLKKIWHKVEKKIKNAPVRSLIFKDISLPLKIVRDYFTDDVEKFIIDSLEDYKYIQEFCDFLTPLQRAAMELYTGPEPLFEAYGIEREIELALQKKIPLESGGSIIIEKTEAMVVIDVNSGRFSGGTDLEDTVFKVNLEAAVEIARQIRLRNLAGMIVIDFIDMHNKKHRNQVLKTLKEAFQGDRQKPSIEQMSELGLVQMTRKRTSLSLQEQLMSTCPCCQGQGIILSPLSLAQKIRRVILQEAKRYETDRIRITAQKEVIDLLRGTDDSGKREIEKRIGCKLEFHALQDTNLEYFKVEPII